MKPAHAILLVEDNPADIKIMQRALRESTFPVDLIVVRDGQEAVEYLLRQGNHAANASWRCPELNNSCRVGHLFSETIPAAVRNWRATTGASYRRARSSMTLRKKVCAGSAGISQ